MVDFNAAITEKVKRKTRVSQVPVARSPFDLTPIRERFTEYDQAIGEMVEVANVHEVKDDTTLKLAVMMAGQAKVLGKRIDDQRKSIIEDPNHFVKAVNGFCSDYKVRLDAIEQGLKRKIGDYQHRLELARREAEKRAQEEAVKLQASLNAEAKEKGVEPVQVLAPVMPEPDRVTRTEAGSAYTRKEWTFKVVNEAEVPREFLCIDERRIREGVRMGLRHIAGVEIFEETKTVLRT